MTTFRIRFRTGPATVFGFAELARAAGLKCYAGTEHLYVLVGASQADAAVHNMIATFLQHKPDMMTEWIWRGSVVLGTFDTHVHGATFYR